MRTNSEKSADPAESVKPERNVSGSFPLTFAQESLWLQEQLSSSTAYSLPEAWRLRGPLNPEALRAGLNALVERHETLRTVFSTENGKPVQVVFETGTLPLQEVAVATTRELNEVIRQECRRPFDIKAGPLARAVLISTAPEEHVLVLNLHHLVCDAWSQAVLIRDLAAIYSGLILGSEPSLPSLPIQLADYAVWQRETYSGENLPLNFWKEQLADAPPPASLIYDQSVATMGASEDGCTRFYSLSPELTASLNEFSRRRGVTSFATLFTTFNVLLHRCTGEQDILLGSPMAGRERVETENLVGLFVNTHALRTTLEGNPRFSEVLDRVRQTALNALENQNVPLSAVVEALRSERALGKSPLFRVVFGLQSEPAEHLGMHGLEAERIELDNGAAKFDWTLLLTRTRDGISIRSEHRSAMYDESTIARLIGKYELLLRCVLQDPEKRISDYDLTAAEERRTIAAWNRTETDFNRDATVQSVFADVAGRYANKPALAAGDRVVTYSELERLAGQFALHLNAAGVLPGDKVAIALERSPELIIAILATLQAGAVYVPLDRSFPPQRKEEICNIAGARFLIKEGLELQSLAYAREPRGESSATSTAASTAYVMFTSGSTGAPKGVAVPHRAILRLVQNPNYIRITDQDVFLQLAPTAFDASTLEIWGALLNGARLVIAPPQALALGELGKLIASSNATLVWLTAGLFNQLVDHEIECLEGVKQLLTGGEALSVAHVEKALKSLPSTQLINGYGPTENTTFSCCYQIPGEWCPRASVPIGKPVSNSGAWVLDSERRICPIGFVGELYVSGDGLALEYSNRPDLTAERFVEVKLDPDAPSLRMYRTGDLARWLDDGTIEFLGRNDTQVKIRGFRIEPSEIEAVLMSHPGVRAALVTTVEGPGGKHLAAYAVPSKETIRGPDLVTFISSRLPSYMVPAKVLLLDQLPLTVNGKVDRRALPNPFADEHLDAPMPPSTEAEKKVAAVWQEVLGRNGFDVRQDFFQLGGQSLLATQVASRLSQIFRVEVPVVAVFEHSTIQSLAASLPQTARDVEQTRPRLFGAASAEDLLGRLDELSESEVEQLLKELEEQTN